MPAITICSSKPAWAYDEYTRSRIAPENQSSAKASWPVDATIQFFEYFFICQLFVVRLNNLESVHSSDHRGRPTNGCFCSYATTVRIFAGLISASRCSNP